MRFTKIKYVGETVLLNWEKPNKEVANDKMSLTSQQEPRPEFHKALKSLKKDLIKFCEVESLDSKLIEVTGVSFKFTGEFDIMNVVISGIKKHRNSGGVLALNTPLKAAQKSDDAAADVLDEKSLVNIKKLIKEAEEYTKGTKLQQSLLD